MKMKIKTCSNCDSITSNYTTLYNTGKNHTVYLCNNEGCQNKRSYYMNRKYHVIGYRKG